MEVETICAEPRNVNEGSLAKLRARGYIPCVLYGKKVGSLPIKVEEHVLSRILTKGTGARGLMSLDINGEMIPAVIKEIQRDVLKGSIIHVDFHQISMKEKIHTQVPVVSLNEDTVIKEGGIVQRQAREVTVECLPGDIPESLVVDLSGMRIGDAVHARDLTLPENVRLASEPDELIVSIVASRRAEEEAEPEEKTPEREEPPTAEGVE
ncbi:MAG: 50S ribosomal protein L25 [Bacillota bacterium]